MIQKIEWGKERYEGNKGKISMTGRKRRRGASEEIKGKVRNAATKMSRKNVTMK